jgi:hypothetical protein
LWAGRHKLLTRPGRPTPPASYLHQEDEWQQQHQLLRCVANRVLVRDIHAADLTLNTHAHTDTHQQQRQNQKEQIPSQQRPPPPTEQQRQQNTTTTTAAAATRRNNSSRRRRRRRRRSSSSRSSSAANKQPRLGGSTHFAQRPQRVVALLLVRRPLQLHCALCDGVPASVQFAARLSSATVKVCSCT